MKAFDVIRPLNQNLNQNDYQPKKEYFTIQQKQQLRVTLPTKILIDSIISHTNKPKVHLIKPKSPLIHILNPKTKSVLGLDTQTQTWSNGTPLIVHDHHPRHSFLDIFKVTNQKDIVNQDNKAIRQSNVMVRNVFEYEQERDDMKSKEEQKQRQIKVLRQENMIESKVEQVDLGKIPQSFLAMKQEDKESHANEQEEKGIGYRIMNFFESVSKRFRTGGKDNDLEQGLGDKRRRDRKEEKKQQQQQEQVNKIAAQQQQILEQRRNIVQSQVQQYNPQMRLGSMLH